MPIDAYRGLFGGGPYAPAPPPDLSFRPALADWLLTGNFSSLQVVPMLAAVGVRAAVGSALGNQFYADVLMSVLLAATVLWLLWRLARSTGRIGGHVFAICTTAPLAALAALGALTLGALLWSIYSLSTLEFPAEHAAINSALALAGAVVVDTLVRIGSLFGRWKLGG